MAWSSTLCNTCRSIASSLGICSGVGAGLGGGALSCTTVASRKFWGAGGAACPTSRLLTFSGWVLDWITATDDTTACPMQRLLLSRLLRGLCSSNENYYTVTSTSKAVHKAVTAARHRLYLLYNSYYKILAIQTAINGNKKRLLCY